LFCFVLFFFFLLLGRVWVGSSSPYPTEQSINQTNQLL
jgi:hypothetical protein